MDDDTRLSLLQQGQQHEKQVLVLLDQQYDLKQLNQNGSLPERFKHSLMALKQPLRPNQSRLLAQCVFMHGNSVGIPDLLKISVQNNRLFIQVGDIKNSLTPFTSQQWQVTFYAHLLQQIIIQEEIDAAVSTQGF